MWTLRRRNTHNFLWCYGRSEDPTPNCVHSLMSAGKIKPSGQYLLRAHPFLETLLLFKSIFTSNKDEKCRWTQVMMPTSAEHWPNFRYYFTCISGFPPIWSSSSFLSCGFFEWLKFKKIQTNRETVWLQQNKIFLFGKQLLCCSIWYHSTC